MPPEVQDELKSIRGFPQPPDRVPDIETQREDLSYQKAQVDNLRQDIELRRTYSNRLFYLIVCYLSFVGLLLAGSAVERFHLKISDPVLVTLLTTTTVNLLGLFAIVTRYIFPKR